MYVKHIMNEEERIMGPFREASKVPRIQTSPGQWSAACVWGQLPDGQMIPLGHWGRYYVTGERGETIARWDLGGEDPPAAVPTPEPAAVAA